MPLRGTRGHENGLVVTFDARVSYVNRDRSFSEQLTGSSRGQGQIDRRAKLILPIGPLGVSAQP